MIDYSLSYRVHRGVAEVIAAADTLDTDATSRAVVALGKYPSDYVFQAMAEAVVDALAAPANTPAKTWAQNRIATLDENELALMNMVEQARSEIDQLEEGENQA